MSDRDFLKDIPGGLIAIFTFIITAIGMLIINFHLNRYYISDYSIISARVIHVGFIFFLFCAGSATFIFAFLETRDYTSNTIKKAFANFISKPVHLTNVFIMFFVFTANTPEESSILPFFGLSLKSYWVYPILMSSVFGITLKITGYQYIKISGDKLGELIDKLSNGLLFIGLLALPIMIYNSEVYRGVFWFFGTISFWCMMYMGIIQDSQRRMKLGLQDINPSLFTKDTKMQSLTFLEKLFGVCGVIIMLLLLSSIYSKSVYPLIDFQYGGGKLINITIMMEDDKTVEGRMLNYDEKRYYLISKDGEKTILIDTTKVKTIQKSAK